MIGVKKRVIILCTGWFQSQVNLVLRAKSGPYQTEELVCLLLVAD